MLSSLFRKGEGSALPGLIGLTLNPDMLKSFVPQCKKGIILISATNGKTTTSSLIAHILSSQNYKVIHNMHGSNLMRGIASVFINNADWKGAIDVDYGVFEVDEAALPKAIGQLKPTIIVLNNLFRDQLDRYGELDSLAYKWKKALQSLDKNTTVILNADDPLIASLGTDIPCTVLYYGLQCAVPEKQTHHYGDSVFCPHCLKALSYQTMYYSHLGIWNCPSCKNKNPQQTLTITNIKPTNTTVTVTLKDGTKITTQLHGIYNMYNVAAAYLAATKTEIAQEKIGEAITSFAPAFGRQEMIAIGDKKVYLILSKNPTGFSQSITTVAQMNPQTILFILNDKIADGEDISWIADIDFSPLELTKTTNILSGTRAHDLALRLKYENKAITTLIEPNLQQALEQALEKTNPQETLYIMPTYTAMLEVRKLLTGKTLT